jgi:hypothetical protein
MIATRRELEKFWADHSADRPEILRGVRGTHQFYTLRDNGLSIYTFVSASDVKIEAGKERKKEAVAYLTVMVPAKYCEPREIEINGRPEVVWNIKPSARLVTTSCTVGPTLEFDLKKFAYESSRQ